MCVTGRQALPLGKPLPPGGGSLPRPQDLSPQACSLSLPIHIEELIELPPVAASVPSGQDLECSHSSLRQTPQNSEFLGRRSWWAWFSQGSVSPRWKVHLGPIICDQEGTKLSTRKQYKVPVYRGEGFDLSSVDTTQPCVTYPPACHSF